MFPNGHTPSEAAAGGALWANFAINTETRKRAIVLCGIWHRSFKIGEHYDNYKNEQ